MRRGAIAIGILIAGAIANPVIASRVLENIQSKGTADHDFAHVVENRSGIITVDTDGTVYGNGMYDGRFNTDLKTDLNGIIRPYALSLFHPAPRDVLMIGLSSGSWAQVIASNPAVASLTIVEINRGYLELIKAQPDVQSILRNPKVRIIEDDGRRWLGHHPEMRFDAIVSNTTWHFRANITNLLSLEFLELVKQHLNPGGVFFYNTTDSRRAQRTACTAFPYGARFINHMVVSQTPIAWDFSRWRTVLENYKIDGKPEFDLKDAADRSRIESDHDRVRPRRRQDRGMSGTAGCDTRPDAHHRRQYGHRVALLSQSRTPFVARAVCQNPPRWAERRSELGDRLQLLALAERAQRRGVGIDPLLDDLAVFDAEFVDAAPVEPDAVDVARGLPFDDHDVAARGPVQQLPDEIRRGRGLHFHQPVEFVARHRRPTSGVCSEPSGCQRSRKALPSRAAQAAANRVTNS